MTLIAIQAEAAAAALPLDPERAAEPVEAIRATAHRTLAEIRVGARRAVPDETTTADAEDLAALARTGAGRPASPTR